MRRIDRDACYDVGAYHRSLWKDYESHNEKAQSVASTGEARVPGFARGYIPEMFHRLYAETPRELEVKSRGAKLRARLHNLASELPEFETLKKQTTRSQLWAGMGAQAISEQILTALPKKRPPDPETTKRQLEGLLELKASGLDVDQEIAETEGTLMGEEYALAEQAEELDDSAIRQALRGAIESAGSEIESAQAACAAFGIGDGLGGVKDPVRALALAKALKSNPSLKRIAELAGRMIPFARAKRASKSEYARSELVGIEQVSSFDRLLPSELSSLSNPVTTADLYRRVTENAALGYKISGKIEQNKGPIIVMLDQSGSMRGGKDEWAKAVALTLLDSARSQNRPFGVILYDDDVRQKLLSIDSDAVKFDQLIALFSSFSGGGTSFSQANEQALTWIRTTGALKNADFINISDGETYNDDSKPFKAACDKLGTNTYGIGIGTSGGSLRNYYHEVFTISDIAKEQGEDLKRILGEIFAKV